MVVERLDVEIRLPFDKPGILSKDPERLADYIEELVNELQRLRLHDIHQRINLLVDLQSGPIVYLGLPDSTGSYPAGTWRLNGTSATEYLVQLMVVTTWTTMATISSGGVLTITDVSISTPSLIYALSHDLFADVHQDVNTTASPTFLGLNFDIVASLPAVTIGKIIRLTTDDRLYYGKV